MTQQDQQRISFSLLLTLAVPTFMVGVDLMVMGVAVEPLAKSLRIGISTLQWLLAGYAIGNASFYVIAGKLADMYGAKKIVNIGLVGFALFSAGIALSHHAGLIIVFRILQGSFGAFIVIGSLTWIGKSFSQEGRSVPVAAIVSGTGLGMSFGPVLGGILIHYFSWRMAFWINVPIAVLGILFVSFNMKRRERVLAEIHYDIPGLILLVASMITLTVFLSQGNIWGWTQERTLIDLGAFILLFIVLIIVESTRKYSLIDFKLLAVKNFFHGSFIAFLGYFIFVAWLFVFGIYLQRVYGFSPLHAGLAFLPFSVAFAISALITGKLIKPIGSKQLTVFAFVCSLIATAILASTDQRTAYWLLSIGFIFLAVGFVIPGTALVPVTIQFVTQEKMGLANGKMMMIRWFGASTGAAMIATIFEEAGLHYLREHLHQYSLLTGHRVLEFLSKVLLGGVSSSQVKQRFGASAYVQAHDLLSQAYTQGLRVSMWVLFGIAVVGLLWTLFLLHVPKSVDSSER